MLWVGAAVWVQGALLLARRGAEPARELAARRRLRRVVTLEHAALVVSLAAGGLLAWGLGLDVGRAGWLGVKVGLVAFLVVPLEGMHAYVNHVWIARGLRETPGPPFSKDLRRGIGMDDMVRTLSLLLLGAGVPLIVWLSTARPF